MDGATSLIEEVDSSYSSAFSQQNQVYKPFLMDQMLPPKLTLFRRIQHPTHRKYKVIQL